MQTTDQATLVATPDALTERLFEAVVAAFDVFAVYIGDKLGFYRALEEGGPATSDELARRTGTAERYVREWLEQQAVTGILTCDETAAAAHARRYRMPEGYGAVLVDPDSLSAMAPLAQVFVGCVKPLPQLLEAFRTGGGVPYEDYGTDLHEGQAGTTRPQFRHLLAQEWIPVMPDIHARLQASPPAHVADIGMGLG
ncbi:MAG TPA: SAM-dependent methyltransferase, partial [Chloroflexota bacterium]|nr:SAM-dependent methyltransferase [Chloroflexota bacterium]